MMTFKARLERIFFDLEKVPKNFEDCITQELIEDPVMLSDGHIYDRESAVQLLGLPQHQRNSPKTREPLNPNVMLDAHDFRSQIIGFVEEKERIAAPFMAALAHQKADYEARIDSLKRLHEMEIKILDAKYRNLGKKHQLLKERRNKNTGWLGWLWSSDPEPEKRDADEDLEALPEQREKKKSKKGETP